MLGEWEAQRVEGNWLWLCVWVSAVLGAVVRDKQERSSRRHDDYELLLF